MNDEVRFYTQANSRFFLATVAMLESLRISGNSAPAFVLDDGLRPGERERLAAMAEVLERPARATELHPRQMKATADLFWSAGVVVLLDADMILTAPLADLIEQARAGKIAVHPDHERNAHRQFQEWVKGFDLHAPLRPQRYVNCTPLAISLDRWPDFFARWRRACLSLPPDWPNQGFDGPFGLPAQDAMNALLMSEIPSDAIWIGAYERTVHADGLPKVDIVDARSLACRYRGATPIVLHFGLDPKPWEHAGWRRIRTGDAYVRLLRRLLFDPDARIPIRAGEVPLWLRPRGIGSTTAQVLGLVNFVRRDLRHQAQSLRNRLLRRRPEPQHAAPQSHSERG
jgi:hypothetical protein